MVAPAETSSGMEDDQSFSKNWFFRLLELLLTLKSFENATGFVPKQLRPLQVRGLKARTLWDVHSKQAKDPRQMGLGKASLSPQLETHNNYSGGGAGNAGAKDPVRLAPQRVDQAPQGNTGTLGTDLHIICLQSEIPLHLQERFISSSGHPQSGEERADENHA